jgi:tRNA-2-methylthio-N6-dimethylallyladenosine synthase
MGPDDPILKPTVDAARSGYFLHTYGCQMNKLDSELIESRLRDAGFAPAASEDAARVVLFNTCSVREHAEDRVWGRIGSLKARKQHDRELVIGLLGCMAREHKEFIQRRMPHVDLVAGPDDFGAIDRLLGQVLQARTPLMAVGQGVSGDTIVRDPKVRPHAAQAYVSVMRGCDMPCTFCIVPTVRGPEVSRPPEAIFDEALRLCADGVTEITLLGQTVNGYGRDLPQRKSFAALLRRLLEIPSLRRLGFVTSHPNFVNEELIDTIAQNPRISRYLHFPAQSGSNALLKRMKRGYSADWYRDRVDRLRARVPDIEMASDFIVGFPGETEADHELTKALMRDVRFAMSFVFKYSPRPGTEAADTMADDVPETVKKRRNQELLDVQQEIQTERNKARVGRTEEVLVEGVSKRDARRFTGRTAHQRLVHFPAADPTLIGRYVPVRITASTALCLFGELLAEDEAQTSRTLLEV